MKYVLVNYRDRSLSSDKQYDSVEEACDGLKVIVDSLNLPFTEQIAFILDWGIIRDCECQNCEDKR